MCKMLKMATVFKQNNLAHVLDAKNTITEFQLNNLAHVLDAKNTN